MHGVGRVKIIHNHIHLASNRSVQMNLRKRQIHCRFLAKLILKYLFQAISVILKLFMLHLFLSNNNLLKIKKANNSLVEYKFLTILFQMLRFKLKSTDWFVRIEKQSWLELTVCKRNYSPKIN